MEQKLRFGLVLGLLAVLKRKFGPIMINFFHVSWGEKKRNLYLLEMLMYIDHRIWKHLDCEVQNQISGKASNTAQFKELKPFI